MTTLTVVQTDSNWEGVYVDNECEYQNHTGRAWARPVLDAIEGHEIESTEIVHVEMKRDDEGRLLSSRLPKTLEELHRLNDFTVEGSL
jgi:hypothetical protein